MDADVRRRSSSLWCLLRRRLPEDQFRRHYRRVGVLHGPSWTGQAGAVDFYHYGDNMLELAASNVPRSAIKEVTSWLLESGCDVHEQSNDSYTPLLSACSRGLAELAETLLQRGANRFKVSPSGEDAFDCVLGFFAACVEFRARALEEDVDLARLCCRLRNSRIERARALGQLPSSSLAETRLHLSQVATQLALLGGKFVRLTKEEVLAKSSVDQDLADSFGEGLWSGWPGAFLTFDTSISEESTFQESFVNVRSRVLAFRLSQSPPHVRGSHGSHHRSNSWAYYEYVDYDDLCFRNHISCTCFGCRAECPINGDYAKKKMQKHACKPETLNPEQRDFRVSCMPS